MNHNTQYYSPTSNAGVSSSSSKGWAGPVILVVAACLAIFCGGGGLLAAVFRSSGPDLAAVIVASNGMSFIAGIGVCFLVYKMWQWSHPPEPAQRATFSGYTMDAEPVGRGTPLIPSRSGLRVEDAKVALTFTNKQVREIPAAAMAWFFSRRGPEDMVRGTNGWRWANEAYSVGRAWLIDQQALRNDNAWIDKQGAMEHLGLWSDHVTQ